MDENQNLEQTPEAILQSKIDELVKQVSELQKEKAKLQVSLTDKQIELDAANHLLDAKTAAASTNDSISELIDENDLSEALMSGKY